MVFCQDVVATRWVIPSADENTLDEMYPSDCDDGPWREQWRTWSRAEFWNVGDPYPPGSGLTPDGRYDWKSPYNQIGQPDRVPTPPPVEEVESERLSAWALYAGEFTIHRSAVEGWEPDTEQKTGIQYGTQPIPSTHNHHRPGVKVGDVVAFLVPADREGFEQCNAPSGSDEEDVATETRPDADGYRWRFGVATVTSIDIEYYTGRCKAITTTGAWGTEFRIDRRADGYIRAIEVLLPAARATGPHYLDEYNGFRRGSFEAYELNQQDGAQNRADLAVAKQREAAIDFYGDLEACIERQAEQAERVEEVASAKRRREFKGVAPPPEIPAQSDTSTQDSKVRTLYTEHMAIREYNAPSPTRERERAARKKRKRDGDGGGKKTKRDRVRAVSQTQPAYNQHRREILANRNRANTDQYRDKEKRPSAIR